MATRKVPNQPELKHTRAEIRAFKGQLGRLYKYGNELEFMQWLREIGIKDEDPRFGPLVKNFRDAKRGKL